MKGTSSLAKLWTAIFCFCFWELLTGSFALREVLLGIVVSVVVAWFSARFFIHGGEDSPLWNPVRALLLLAYSAGRMLVEMIKANVDVAFRVFEKDMKLNPGIVKIPVDLDSEYALSTLANSITLTPGTITMAVSEEDGKNYFYVHWIDVASRDPEKAADAIKGSMEPAVRRIWQ